MRICLYCEKELPIRKRQDSKYCSKSCSSMFNNNKANPNPVKFASNVSVGTKGAIGEYAVCVDLLRQGWEVFKAVSPSCSCDLIIQNKDGAKRVEVRTGRTNLYGTVNTVRKHKADVLAIVLRDKIVYEPPL